MGRAAVDNQADSAQIQVPAKLARRGGGLNSAEGVNFGKDWLFLISANLSDAAYFTQYLLFSKNLKNKFAQKYYF